MARRAFEDFMKDQQKLSSRGVKSTMVSEPGVRCYMEEAASNASRHEPGLQAYIQQRPPS